MVRHYCNTLYNSIIDITIAVNGSEQIRVRWMTPLSQRILPNGFSMATFPRFTTNSSGFIVSNGLLLEDSNTYRLTSMNYDGALLLDIIVDG